MARCGAAMTPGARLYTAIELCGIIEDEAAAADSTVDSYFRRRRYAGAKDRRAVSARVYNVLRRRSHLDWWIARVGGRADARGRIIADLALGEHQTLAEITRLFSGAPHCPAPLSPGERAMAEALCGQPLHHPDMPVPVTGEFPAWLEDTFVGLWGDALTREVEALNRPAPLDVRVNTLKATRDDARAALAADGVESAPTPLSPIGLRVRGRVRLGGTAAFRDGLIEVQDEGSQLIALLTDARPGMEVIDFCAGAGGKTLAFAAAMERGGRVRGRVTACDISAKRMRRMEIRLQRAGTRDVRRRVLSSERDSWIAENVGRADRLLLDVPCTGSGIWRRNPDAKWRLTAASVDDTVARQRRIAESASRLVKPGGRLVYATCSLLPEENEAQVDWLLARRPEFSVVPVAEVWSEAMSGPCPVPGPYLRLSPGTTDTDGYFAAVLRRAP